MLGTGNFPDFPRKNLVPKKRDRECRPLGGGGELNDHSMSVSTKETFSSRRNFRFPPVSSGLVVCSNKGNK